jgi:hypothetical protein
MKRKIQPFYPLLFVFLSLQLAQAQDPVSFTATTHTIEQGEPVEVEFYVTNFIDMISAQFTIEYDPAVLDFVSVGDFGLDYMANNSFGTPPDVDDGVVTFVWYDESISGITVDDEEVIFTVTFQATGMPGDSSAITFGNSPTMVEVTNTGGMIMDPGFNPGYVKIASMSGVRTVVTDAFVFHPIAPNPVNELATVRFELFEGTQTNFTIYDMTGRVIYAVQEYRATGDHVLEIPGHLFPANGSYFCRLEAGGHKGIQKILLMR